MSKYRKKVDWVSIEPDWAAGQLSKAEIGRKHDVSVAALNKRFKKRGLIYGSLSSSIRLKVDAKLVEEPDKPQVSVQVSGVEPDDVVDQAAEVLASVIRSHRKDIAGQFIIKAKSELLLSAIDVPDVNGGEKLSMEQLVHVKAFVDTADRLVQTTERLIKLQRQAFSLDDAKEKGDRLHTVVIHDPTAT